MGEDFNWDENTDDRAEKIDPGKKKARKKTTDINWLRYLIGLIVTCIVARVIYVLVFTFLLTH